MSAGHAEVVVTGLGAIAGHDCGAERIAELLAGGAMRTREVDRSGGYHLPQSARLAVLTSGLDLSAWVPPALGRRMSPPSKLAVGAARMATADAGFTSADAGFAGADAGLSGADAGMAAADAGLSDSVGGPRTAVVMSVAFGAVNVTESLLRTVLEQGPEMASPFQFTESVANAAAAQVAIATRAEGSNLTIVQGEAGGLTAIGRGAAEVAAGRADRALVGHVQEMPPILHAMLDRFGALARPGSAGGEVARPFDRNRGGFVAAEGAVVLVLEDARRARERGATIRARIRGFGAAFDPTAPRIGWGRGHASLARALRRLLARLGVSPSDVGRIVSGASGSIAGDRLEAETLREAWDSTELPPILAPKGVTGEYGGGFLASAVLAATDRGLAATAGFSEPDPALAITPYQGGALPDTDLTLVTTLASGGAAAWLLLERP